MPIVRRNGVIERWSDGVNSIPQGTDHPIAPSPEGGNGQRATDHGQLPLVLQLLQQCFNPFAILCAVIQNKSEFGGIAQSEALGNLVAEVS